MKGGVSQNFEEDLSVRTRTASSPAGGEVNVPEFGHGKRKSDAHFIFADGFFPHMDHAAFLLLCGTPVFQDEFLTWTDSHD